MTILTATTTLSEFTCLRTDSVFSAIEKCLDNGLGLCFVLDGDRHLLGQIVLDDIRRAVLDGSAFADPAVGRHLSYCPSAVSPYTVNYSRETDRHPGDGSAVPVTDSRGRLVDVVIDRSRQGAQLAQPHLSHLEFRAMLDAFLSSWISSKGPYIGRFEQDFASFVGVRHGIAVSNGTAALHLALLALGIGAGDEVIVPDFTFAATINAVFHCGAVPVIVDVDPTTWTMSLDGVRKAFTPRTKAIIPVHIYGRPAEIGPIAAFAKERNCAVVEDCAEAHGARYRRRAVGQFGDVSCFSFYGNKVVTTGEGGMCLTQSDTLAAKIRELRDHGRTPDPDRPFWHGRVGYNYRMTNPQAAIGQAQLSRIEGILERNRRLERLYQDRLGSIPGVSFPPPMGPECEAIVWLVCVQVPAEAQSSLITAARRANIELRPFFYPLSAMPPYRAFAGDCPNSVLLSRTGLNLPTSNAVDRHVVDKIADIFEDILSAEPAQRSAG